MQNEQTSISSVIATVDGSHLCTKAIEFNREFK